MFPKIETDFSKNYVFAYYFCVIDGRMIFCISGEGVDVFYNKY